MATKYSEVRNKVVAELLSMSSPDIDEEGILDQTEAVLGELIQDRNNVTPNIKMLVGMIYRYYQPSPSSRAHIDPVAWVAQAAGEDETRPHLTHCYSTGKILAATDCHTLHILKTDAFKPGYYDPKTMAFLFRSREELNFPDVEAVLFKEGGDKVLHTMSVTLDDFEEISEYGAELDTPYGIRRVQVRYLRQAFAGSTDMELTYNEDELGMLQLTRELRTVCLMPVRRGD